jgi:hypothetical protein
VPAPVVRILPLPGPAASVQYAQSPYPAKRPALTISSAPCSENKKPAGIGPAGFSQGATMTRHRSFLRKIIVKIGVKVKIRVILR